MGATDRTARREHAMTKLARRLIKYAVFGAAAAGIGVAGYVNRDKIAAARNEKILPAAMRAKGVMSVDQYREECPEAFVNPYA